MLSAAATLQRANVADAVKIARMGEEIQKRVRDYLEGSNKQGKNAVGSNQDPRSDPSWVRQINAYVAALGKHETLGLSREWHGRVCVLPQLMECLGGRLSALGENVVVDGGRWEKILTAFKLKIFEMDDRPELMSKADIYKLVLVDLFRTGSKKTIDERIKNEEVPSRRPLSEEAAEKVKWHKVFTRYIGYARPEDEPEGI